MGGYSISFPLYLPYIGFFTITVSWAQVKASTVTGPDRTLRWNNYGPKKDPIWYIDYLRWNEILGSLNSDRPRDVGVGFDMYGNLLGLHQFTVWTML